MNGDCVRLITPTHVYARRTGGEQKASAAALSESVTAVTRELRTLDYGVGFAGHAS
jgi:hypothetical protein